MILQNADNPNSLYRMDLEYGKVVDEWKVHDDIPVTTFAPEKVSLFSALHQCILMLAEILANDWGADIPRVIEKCSLSY